MVDKLSQRLVPDELWALVEPLLPQFNPRPQGGGTAPVEDWAMFTAIVYVLTSGCAWRLLPASFGVPVPTAHRRFTEWTKAGLWRRLHRAVLDELGSQGMVDWSRAVLDGASVRAKRGSLTGPSPVDRGKPGSKIHVLSDRVGIPLSVAVSAANTNDAHTLKPLVMAIPAIKSRRGPRRRKPTNFTPARPTTTATSATGSAITALVYASPAKALSPATSSANTAGSSNDRSPGSSATAD